MKDLLTSWLRRQLLRAKYRDLELGPRSTIRLSSFGSQVRIGEGAFVDQCAIGDFSYVGPRAVLCNAVIGKFCSIALEGYIGTGGHPARTYVSTHPMFYLTRPRMGWTLVDRDLHQEFKRTTIGNDVWIGARAIIRDGVNIADGAIVGAGAVLVKDAEPFGVYAGVPAKLIRHRFTVDQIEFLMAFKWWDRDSEWRTEHAGKFRDIDDFVRYFSTTASVAPVSGL
jgi:acetyltransferase-like isoleucine patch superfamily enzyme